MNTVIRAATVALQLINVACLQEGTEHNTTPYIPPNSSALPPGPSHQNQASSPRAGLPSFPRPHASAAEPDAEGGKSTPSDTDRLAEWYSVRSNYEMVLSDVREFYKPVRYNGCVAFISAALRRIGIDIPIATGQQESPSLVTRPFSQHLENKLGWRRIGSASNLRPGDVVFTRDNPSYPGYPAHTYMFHDWSRRDLGIAFVVDNQDFKHERNIYDNDTAFNFTPYAYALRAP